MTTRTSTSFAIESLRLQVSKASAIFNALTHHKKAEVKQIRLICSNISPEILEVADNDAFHRGRGRYILI